jgi:hypothetical protein
MKNVGHDCGNTNCVLDWCNFCWQVVVLFSESSAWWLDGECKLEENSDLVSMSTNCLPKKLYMWKYKLVLPSGWVGPSWMMDNSLWLLLWIQFSPIKHMVESHDKHDQRSETYYYVTNNIHIKDFPHSAGRSRVMAHTAWHHISIRSAVRFCSILHQIKENTSIHQIGLCLMSLSLLSGIPQGDASSGTDGSGAVCQEYY